MSAQRLLSDSDVPAYLRELGLADAGEPISVTPAGDGNINWVRRVSVGGERARSLVLKQARPALERFPQYSAPTERLLCEARWLELAAAYDSDAICPRVLALDAENRVLALEDLSACERLDAALARGRAVETQMEALARLLARIHAATEGDRSLPARFDNEPMRRLHGEHIFLLPYRPNDFGLTPRIEAAARELRDDAALAASVAETYVHYCSPQGALVHADVQAGNVLLTPSGGVKLLDAEIAHVGDAAFDLGTLLAHLALPALACGESASARLGRVGAAYRAERGCDARTLARARVHGGCELIRRTIGAARVAAVASDAAGLRVLSAGRSWVLGGCAETDG